MESHPSVHNPQNESKMPTFGGLEFDTEGLNDFRRQVERLSIPGLNPLHLTGVDMMMWRKFKMNTLDKKEFQDYYSGVEKDKIAHYAESIDRYLFAAYIFNNTKFE